jgi:hypothetical protein
MTHAIDQAVDTLAEVRQALECSSGASDRLLLSVLELLDRRLLDILYAVERLDYSRAPVGDSERWDD